MHIRDIMTTRVATVSMDDRLSVIKDIFEQAHFRHLLVLEAVSYTQLTLPTTSRV